jgi:hypothetical protein
VSSPLEPLFGPLSLIGVLILLYIVIRVIQALIVIGPRPKAPLPMAEIQARRHALGKILASLLLWSGLLMLDGLAWAAIFVQGDDLRVLPGAGIAALLLGSGGLIAVSIVVRLRLRGRGTPRQVGSQFARR